eukprot:TRINITY_DN4184_c0_g1_i1.p1 TRINITY_DN4184_c0_g1~~TRINITY_DN4184_c0_g1_i1.p1  ORF type:complete len:333 (+),score=70.14 TRINITY_DN4184_c0_g1_i1:64-1062(+)
MTSKFLFLFLIGPLLVLANTQHRGTNQFWLTGTVAAIYTPFFENGSLNLLHLEEQAKWLKETGVTGVFVAGTNGESVLLTSEERKSLASKWVTVGHQYGLKVIIHAGSDSVVDAIQLAAHAQAIGADAVGAMPPSFFKPSSMANLVVTMTAIANACPQFPFYYYHIPSKTGVSINDDFVSALAAAIPNLNGFKFSDTDTRLLSRIMRYKDAQGKTMNVLYGTDENMPAALMNGVDGFVGSTYGFANKLYTHLMDNFKAGNTSAVMIDQRRSQDMVSIVMKYSTDNQFGFKATFQLRTKCDMGPPRLPLVRMTDANLKAMNDELTAIGFYKWT